MKASIEKQGDITVVVLAGTVNLEVTDPFRQVCLTHLLHEKLVFNMKDLNFVGSTGLTLFVGVIKEVNNLNDFGLKVVGAKPEFRRLIQAQIDEGPLHFYDEMSMALGSFGFMS